MQRRAFAFGRNAAFEFENDLIAVARAAHDEYFAGVAVFQTKSAGCKTGSMKLPRRSVPHVAPILRGRILEFCVCGEIIGAVTAVRRIQRNEESKGCGNNSDMR